MAVAKRAGPSKPPRLPAHLALYEIIRTVRPLHRALARAVGDRLEGTGVSIGMRAVLECINDAGPQTVPQIGRTLGIKRQCVQRTVNASLALELVRVAENPAHRRSSLVALTAKGERVFREIRDREQDTLRRVGRRATRADIDASLRVLALLGEEFRLPAEEGYDDA